MREASHCDSVVVLSLEKNNTEEDRNGSFGRYVTDYFFENEFA